MNIYKVTPHEMYLQPNELERQIFVEANSFAEVMEHFKGLHRPGQLGEAHIKSIEIAYVIFSKAKAPTLEPSKETT